MAGRNITIYLDEETHNALNALRNDGESLSTILRKCVKAGIESISDSNNNADYNKLIANIGKANVLIKEVIPIMRKYYEEGKKHRDTEEVSNMFSTQ